MGRWAYGCRGFVLVLGVRGKGAGEGGGDCTGVVAAAGREFVAACKIPNSFFFPFFNTRYTNDLVIMTQQDSLLGQGSVGGPWVSLQGQRCVE